MRWCVMATAFWSCADKSVTVKVVAPFVRALETAEALFGEP